MALHSSVKEARLLEQQQGASMEPEGSPSLPGPSEPSMPLGRGLGGPAGPGSHSPKVLLPSSSHSPEVDIGEEEEQMPVKLRKGGTGLHLHPLQWKVDS